MRTCTRCNVSKEESNFCKSPINRSGLEYWCKECKATYYRGRVSKRAMIRQHGMVCQECHTVCGEEDLRMVSGILACRECAYLRRKAIKTAGTSAVAITAEVGVTTVTTVTSVDELA